ncbi:MAG: (d)CMP kinase [Oscillibacter sp.]|nr:(d)CMP kinase [Oscillibacter sp.]
MKHFNVAIDGPSGAGKSTLARRAAEDFDLLYVDTGAIYRTVGLYALETRTDTKDPEAVAAMLPDMEIRLSYSGDGLQIMRLNRRDVTSAIRRPEVSLAASAVSAHPAVRAFLIQTQRGLARDYSVVMDGRDIGTVVLPNAALKVYLTASLEERARRRTRELEQRGTPRPYENVLKEMEQRDYEDTHRAIAPLRQAEDAVLLDTTNLNFQESLDALEKLMRERMGL